MKRLSITTLTIAGIILFASCKSGQNVKQILSKSETRMEVMNKIADNSSMSNEMLEAMLNNKKGNWAIMENQTFILELTKDDPCWMQLVKDDKLKTGIVTSNMPSILMIN